MVHLCAEPRAGHCRPGPVRRSDHWLRPALCVVIVRLDRRDLVWINIIVNPTAKWIARQIAEAFLWNEHPQYLIRDRDRVYGTMVTRRLRAMGIRGKPTSPASPWQNGFAERLIGSIRRECLDYFIILGEAHLRERTGHWTEMHRSLARFGGSGPYAHARSLVTSLSLCPGLGFRYTPTPYLAALAPRRRRPHDRSLRTPELHR